MIEAKDLTKRYGDTLAVDGRHVHDPSWPLREVGALLESRSSHPGRSAQAHLQMRMTQRHGIAGLLGDHEVLLFDEPVNELGPGHQRLRRGPALDPSHRAAAFQLARQRPR